MNRFNGLTQLEHTASEAIAKGLSDFLNLDPDARKPQKAIQWISLHSYPFGERTNYAYKVWLKEVRLVDDFLTQGLSVGFYMMWRKSYRKPRKPNEANERKKRSYNPDQLTLSLF